jgi:RNA polymerase sigma-70 factor (ECF subfamily)
MALEEQYDKIYRFCYYRTQNRETAEDLTQETFLKFLKSDYQERGIGIRYLYTIARNLCIEEARRKKQDPLPEVLSDEGKGADDIVEQIRVRQALMKLPDEDRDLIIMRFVNEESITDICKLMGMSRFALYRKLKSLQRKLIELLGGGIDDYE